MEEINKAIEEVKKHFFENYSSNTGEPLRYTIDVVIWDDETFMVRLQSGFSAELADGKPQIQVKDGEEAVFFVKKTIIVEYKKGVLTHSIKNEKIASVLKQINNQMVFTFYAPYAERYRGFLSKITISNEG